METCDQRQCAILYQIYTKTMRYSTNIIVESNTNQNQERNDSENE